MNNYLFEVGIVATLGLATLGLAKLAIQKFTAAPAAGTPVAPTPVEVTPAAGTPAAGTPAAAPETAAADTAAADTSFFASAAPWYSQIFEAINRFIRSCMAYVSSFFSSTPAAAAAPEAPAPETADISFFAPVP